MINAIAIKAWGLLLATAEAGHTAATGSHSPDTAPHPNLPPLSHWPQQMWTVIGILFAAAIIAGLFYQPKVEPAPAPHSDDAHGHDQGHGHSAGHH